jgi:hypothetical protein
MGFSLCGFITKYVSHENKKVDKPNPALIIPLANP